MNLVEFDSDSRNLVMSKQFWLYFVISIPLTILTLACWKWRTRMYTGSSKDERRTPKINGSPNDSNVDIEMGKY